MLVSHFMITYSFVFGKLKGSSTLLHAHGKGGASATILSFLSVPPSEKSAGGFQQAGKKEGGWGEFRHAGANTKRGRTRRLLCQEQKPAKKFSFPFRRKNPARANQEKRRKLFCWVASVSERRRGGASVPFKEISSKV